MFHKKAVPLHAKLNEWDLGRSELEAYLNEWGFREFTHPQTVLKGHTRFNLSLREHPYTGGAGKKKMKLLRLFER